MNEKVDKQLLSPDVHAASTSSVHGSYSVPTTRSSSPSAKSSISEIVAADGVMARPSLPTSLSEFALPSGPSGQNLSVSVHQFNDSTQIFTPLNLKDELGIHTNRVRRSTISTLRGNLWMDIRVNSPLATSFTSNSSSIFQRSEDVRGLARFREDNDYSSSSGSDFTPPLLEPSAIEDKLMRTKSGDSDSIVPSTPLRRRPSESSATPVESEEFQVFRNKFRHMSYPIKPPRLMDLATESRPEESELKSEAQFQRMLASYSGSPIVLRQNKSSRPVFNRGRYPEEADADEDLPREDTPSDDGAPEEDSGLSNLIFKQSSGSSEPINIVKPMTPANSVLGTPEDYLMDIDTPISLNGSPSVPSNAAMSASWRQTPPPTSSAVRTNKRKYDDRYDPYAPSAKRRAGSPSISTLRDPHSLITPIVIPRSPVLRARNSISHSQANSTASSPIVSQTSSNHLSANSSFANSLSLSLSQHTANGSQTTNATTHLIHHRSGSIPSSSVVSSPTIRTPMILPSPVLRPVPRLAIGSKRGPGEAEGREIDGAGEAVGSLSLE